MQNGADSLGGPGATDLAPPGAVPRAGPPPVRAALDHLHAGAETLGLLYAVFPIGYLVSSVWLGGKTRIRRRGLIAYAGQIIAGLGLLVFGLSLPLPVLVVAAFANGMALEAFSLIWTNTLQELVPAAQLGRVASIDLLGSFALLPVGFALTGWAVDRKGAAPVFLLGGGLAALVAALGLLHPAIRRLD